MPIMARMSSIMGQIEAEHLELFALEFGKIAESDFVYTLASTNINQSAPNLVKMYMTIRSPMSFMDLMGPKLSYLPLNLKICHINQGLLCSKKVVAISFAK